MNGQACSEGELLHASLFSDTVFSDTVFLTDAQLLIFRGGPFRVQTLLQPMLFIIAAA